MYKTHGCSSISSSATRSSEARYVLWYFASLVKPSAWKADKKGLG